MAVTRIRTVRVRFVKPPPEEAERRRRTLLQLQVRSILKAHQAAQEAKEAHTMQVPCEGEHE